MASDARMWRELERQLAEPSSFDRLLQQEEEMESMPSRASAPCAPPSSKGDTQLRWAQRALNRVSSFGIAENGLPSIQTKRALQKFQAEQGLRPTGTLTPRTRAALAELSGVPAPRKIVSHNDELLGETESPTGPCPVDTPTVIRGFSQYDETISQLPPDQQNKLTAIAAEIAASLSGAPGVTSVTQVVVIGHSDQDLDMEKRNPGFVQYVSEKRAFAVLEDLNCRFIAAISNSPTPNKLSGSDWIGVGRGARALAVAAPRNEAERKCNRRAEIILVRSPRLPKLSQPPNSDLLSDHDLIADFYHVALQGTSGQYEHAQIAVQKAREIAERSVRFIKFKLRERAKKCPAVPDLQGFTPFFKDALQGTASKYSDTNVVVDRAAEIAEHAGFTIAQAQHNQEWKYAILPQPMAPDCEIVVGQVQGPANHTLCGPHGHILDTTARTVIAHDLVEYKKLFGG
jgi:outer membrane protein OmpA-like peptidoglycan-associated protein